MQNVIKVKVINNYEQTKGTLPTFTLIDVCITECVLSCLCSAFLLLYIQHIKLALS